MKKNGSLPFHTACDRNGFVLGALVTPANVHDSQVFEEVLNEVTRMFGFPRAVVADAGYKIPHISKWLMDANIRPIMPCTRLHAKDGFLSKHEYVYDEYYDCYICPKNELLTYETTTREGYRVYLSNPETRRDCPLLLQCTKSKDFTKQSADTYGPITWKK